MMKPFLLKHFIFFFLSLFFLSPALAAQNLSPSEEKIRQYIQSQQVSQIKLLEKLVNINSGTANIQGVQRVGNQLKPFLKQLGFKVSWVKLPAQMKRAPTLIASRQGSNGKRLLLIGHLDTVFAKNNPFKRYEKQNEKIAKGPGVIDDKGGLVVLVYALKALQAQGALENTSITIVLTGDEEESGKPTSISRKPLFEAAKNRDIALDFEPAVNVETSTIARRGVGHWQIEATGMEAHSASVFQKNVGAGAIFEAARILNTMREKLWGETYLTFNPGIIIGGTKIEFQKTSAEGSAFGKQNVVAKKALVIGDYRFINEEQNQSFQNHLAEIVKAHLPSTSAILSFEAGIPAMPPTENNLALLKKYSEASEALGYGSVKPLDAGVRGAGDISHIAHIVPANLSGLGPVGHGGHSMIESIELATLAIQTERAAILIYRLTRADAV